MAPLRVNLFRPPLARVALQTLPGTGLAGRGAASLAASRYVSPHHGPRGTVVLGGGGSRHYGSYTEIGVEEPGTTKPRVLDAIQRSGVNDDRVSALYYPGPRTLVVARSSNHHTVLAKQADALEDYLDGQAISLSLSIDDRGENVRGRRVHKSPSRRHIPDVPPHLWEQTQADLPFLFEPVPLSREIDGFLDQIFARVGGSRFSLGERARRSLAYIHFSSEDRYLTAAHALIDMIFPFDTQKARDGILFLNHLGLPWHEITRLLPMAQLYYGSMVSLAGFNDLDPDTPHFGYPLTAQYTHKAPFITSQTDTFRRAMDIRRGQIVLDPMAGVGQHTLGLATDYPDTHVIAMELNPYNVQQIVAQAYALGLDSTLFHAVPFDVKDPFPYENDSIDRGMMNGYSTYGFSERELRTFFAEWLRVMKSEGRIWVDFIATNLAPQYIDLNHIKILQEVAASMGIELVPIPLTGTLMEGEYKDFVFAFQIIKPPSDRYLLDDRDRGSTGPAPLAHPISPFGYCFVYEGRIYNSPADLAGVNPEFEPNENQLEINVQRIRYYAREIEEKRWNWDGMRTLDVRDQIVEDYIDIGITPSGRRIILDGHHRYLTARMLGLSIPDSAFRYERLDREPPVTTWASIDWLWYDYSGRFPVLSPPPMDKG
ncbi:MAG TPA: hypothetical protein DDW49_07095 [Deltaproteobacteria bacterium]|nr:hypothetical protein [Deltaproteobacteria bacterium]